MKFEPNWRQKSLENLEKRDWGDAKKAPTDLIRRCLELSKVPIGDFSLGDLRIMIGQQCGLPFLVPIALEKLQDNLFVEADYYEGDLLSALLSIDVAFWLEHQDHWNLLNQLVRDNGEQIRAKRISTAKFDSSKD